MFIVPVECVSCIGHYYQATGTLHGNKIGRVQIKDVK